jgi:hypothetical protein
MTSNDSPTPFISEYVSTVIEVPYNGVFVFNKKKSTPSSEGSPE